MRADLLRRSRAILQPLAVMAAILGTLCAAQATSAQSVPIALRNSVPIGANGLCEAQIQAPQPGDGLFDRRYAVICRDAAAAIGTLAVIADSEPAIATARFAPRGTNCTPTRVGELPESLQSAQQFSCDSGTGLQQMMVVGRTRNETYVATGLTVYADALRLGLEILATGQLAEGSVEIPLTQASDASAFARAQAEAIGPEAALFEAYRRANSGNFAEAAAFFAASADTLEGDGAIEARLNAALQHSNLGNYLEAAAIFVEVQAQVGNDPVLTRLARNFEALDAINRDSPAEALLVLDTPLPAGADDFETLGDLEIAPPLAALLAAEQGNAITGATGALSVLERVRLLDGQADYIRATALRASGEVAEADTTLVAAQDAIVAVREGRVASVLWLRAQILAERAELAEQAGRRGEAAELFAAGIALLEANYPASPALVSARAQLAGFYARTGREAEALELFRAIVDDAESKPTATLRRLLAPYFALLTGPNAPQSAAAEMFAASQLLQRPGLAQTQAVLARELSGGSDEASQLFRQTLNVSRAIERLRGEIAQGEMDSSASDGAAAQELQARRDELASLQTHQLSLQQQLAQYPRYRVVGDSRLALADLQAALAPGEAYYKLVMLDGAGYAIFVRPDSAETVRVAAEPAAIGAMVDNLRDSIAIEQAGQTITYPFEIALARQLYVALFGEVDAGLRGVTHLVFEPDGDLLRLPANLLVMDDASVTRYNAQADTADGDPYDFTGTQWLGRAMQVTTAVSPTSFRDVRSARGSDAAISYLGLGSNLPLGTNAVPNRGTRSGGAMERCQWTAGLWNNPIRPDELRTANRILGQGSVLTGADFSDTSLAAMEDLDNYRILHFATHGLVTAPEPECPPRPALLTSFGDSNSDGLLSFAEIFDLQLDADLVILSACNTAGVGGLAATREAGVSGGGDFALDGLVRAFVGAGGRTVVASHWPVPDEYDATNRLISGLFSAGELVPTTEALRRAQLGLMDDAATSHPFYWSAFAVVGDGAIPVRR